MKIISIKQSIFVFIGHELTKSDPITIMTIGRAADMAKITVIKTLKILFESFQQINKSLLVFEVRFNSPEPHIMPHAFEI